MVMTYVITTSSGRRAAARAVQQLFHSHRVVAEGAGPPRCRRQSHVPTFQGALVMRLSITACTLSGTLDRKS